MKITVNQAQLSDVDEVSQLFNDYRIFYKQKSDIALAKEFLTQRVTQSESIIFYAKDGSNKYLGFVQLFPVFSSVSAQRIWLLNDLYVSKVARGHGIGTLLLNRAKQMAKKLQAKGIVLETEIQNEGAQKLYEKLGYVKDQEHYHYFLAIKN